MNAEEDSRRGKQRQAIQQTTMMLPYFDEEVPVLYLSSTPYGPVIALCEMPGLRILCGMWTVCYSKRETETSLHLLPGRFIWYTGNRDHLFYKKGDAYEDNVIRSL